MGIRSKSVRAIVPSGQFLKISEVAAAAIAKIRRKTRIKLATTKVLPQQIPIMYFWLSPRDERYAGTPDKFSGEPVSIRLSRYKRKLRPAWMIAP